MLLTPDEVCEALAIGLTRFYELVNTGQLRSLKIGQLRRVPIEALESFIEANIEAGP